MYTSKTGRQVRNKGLEPKSQILDAGQGFLFICVGGYPLWCFRVGMRGLGFSLFIEKFIHLVPTAKAILFDL